MLFRSNNAHRDDPSFHKFRRQLLHSSLVKMLESLKLGMTTAKVVRCSDDHFRRAVYGLGPYIGDYPEQTALTCVVQNWCPKKVFGRLYILCMMLTLFIQMHSTCGQPRWWSTPPTLQGTYRNHLSRVRVRATMG